MSDSSDLDALIINTLLADNALMAIATDGVWYGAAGPNCSRYVIVNLQAGHDEGEFGDVAFEQPVYLVKSVLRNGNAADSKTAALRIFEDLQGLEARLAPGAVPGYVVMCVQRREPIRYLELDTVMPDLRWQHRGGLYEVMAAPTPATKGVRA